MFKIILTVVIAFFLTACGHDKELIRDSKVVYVKVPEYLTEECLPVQPISSEEYMKLKPHKREEYLATYSADLLGVINTCNIRMKKIIEYNAKIK